MLDWLADDFVRNGWRVKRFRKQDVMSTAYRQTSQRNETLDRIDPENLLLGRMNLQRLEAEAIRDAIIAVAGRINLQVATGAVAF